MRGVQKNCRDFANSLRNPKRRDFTLVLKRVSSRCAGRSEFAPQFEQWSREGFVLREMVREVSRFG